MWWRACLTDTLFPRNAHSPHTQTSHRDRIPDSNVSARHFSVDLMRLSLRDIIWTIARRFTSESGTSKFVSRRVCVCGCAAISTQLHESNESPAFPFGCWRHGNPIVFFFMCVAFQWNYNNVIIIIGQQAHAGVGSLISINKTNSFISNENDNNKCTTNTSDRNIITHRQTLWLRETPQA